jgi:hypothetical protein
MRGWLRSGVPLLLALIVLAALAWLRYRPGQEAFPAGSSYSTEADGVRALYLWLAESGHRVQRLERVDPTQRVVADALLVLQPRVPLPPQDQALFDGVAERGGVIVVAGNGPTTGAYTAHLGMTLAGGTFHQEGVTPGGASTVPLPTRFHIEAEDATPLLVAPNGDVLAARRSYGGGQVVVIAGPAPLTNGGLRDNATARFVYQEIVARLPANGVVLFDEAHRDLPLSGDDGFTTRMFRWVAGTSVGGAAVAAGGLVFLYLLLSGRRLGPALRPTAAGASSRTMFEHVQALAGLYRRARQFPYVQAYYARHYRRRLARAIGADTPLASHGALLQEDLTRRGLSVEQTSRLTDAIGGLAGARNERELVGAVQRAETVFDAPPGDRRAVTAAPTREVVQTHS